MKHIILLIVLFAVTTAIYADATDVRFTIITPRGVLKSHNKWRNIGHYISDQIGKHISVVHLPPKLIMVTAKMGNSDFILTNPTIALNLQEKLGFKPIATLNRNVTGSLLGGVIIARKDSGIETAKDLIGKKVVYFKKGSAAANIFQLYHLKTHGVDPKRDFASFSSLASLSSNYSRQDQIVQAVMNNVIDAGFVKTGIIEAMAKEGKLSLSEVSIVDRQTSEYPHAHTTKLYPEWYVVASPKMDQKVVGAFQQALLAMKPKNKVAEKARIQGFVEPLPSDDLKEVLVTLKAPPFN